MQDNECSVCLEGLRGQRCIRLECGHRFHRYCLFKSACMQRMRRSPHSCPYCRTTFRFGFVFYPFKADSLASFKKWHRPLYYKACDKPMTFGYLPPKAYASKGWYLINDIDHESGQVIVSNKIRCWFCAETLTLHQSRDEQRRLLVQGHDSFCYMSVIG